MSVRRESTAGSGGDRVRGSVEPRTGCLLRRARGLLAGFALLSTGQALADCGVADLRLTLAGSAFLESPDYPEEGDTAGKVGLSARCRQPLGDRWEGQVDVAVARPSYRSGVESQVTDLYASYRMAELPARPFIGVRYDRSGFMEAFLPNESAARSSLIAGPLEREWLGARMLGVDVDLGTRWSLQAALVDNESVSEQWRPGGERLSPVGIDLGEDRFEGGRAAYLLEARYYGRDVEMVVNAWDGAERTSEVVFDPRSGELDRTYRRETSIGVSWQYALDDQSLRLDLRGASADAGTSQSVALGYITYLRGMVGPASTTSLYLEYYREYPPGDRVGVAFDNDIAAGARMRLGNSTLTSLEVGLIHDLDHDSRLFNVAVATDLSPRVRATLGYEDYRVGREDQALAAFANDDRVYVSAEIAF